MERRKFLKGAALGAGAVALATPAVSQGTRTMTIVSTWPRDFPGYNPNHLESHAIMAIEHLACVYNFQCTDLQP